MGIENILELEKENKQIILHKANQTKGNFYNAIKKQNKIVENHKPTTQEQKEFQAIMNSYLGTISHYKSYKLRKKMIFNNISKKWSGQTHTFLFVQIINEL